MPVIECSCGMVMSVPVGRHRVGCIRCGGAEFHVLDQPVVDTFRAQPGLVLSMRSNEAVAVGIAVADIVSGETSPQAAACYYI